MINKDILRDYYKGYGIDEDVFDFGEKILDELKERFDNIDRVAEINHLRVMDAFRKKASAPYLKFFNWKLPE